MKFNFEVGKKYKRRNGDIATCTDIRCGAASFDRGSHVWIDSGERHRKFQTQDDIVEEVKGSEMNIEVGKFYKLRGGDKAFVGFSFKTRLGYQYAGYHKLGGEELLVSWYTNGKYYTLGESDHDIVEEWKEPKNGVRYALIYGDNSCGKLFHTKAEADEWMQKGFNTLACVRVEWKEGQFDE